MSPGPETALVRRIRDAVKKLYPHVWIVKMHGGPYQEIGLPDLVACVNGRLVGLEVKCQQPGESVSHARNRATPPQLAQLDRIRSAGGLAAVVVSVDEALAVLDQTVERTGNDAVNATGAGTAADPLQPDGAGSHPD